MKLKKELLKQVVDVVCNKLVMHFGIRQIKPISLALYTTYEEKIAKNIEKNNLYDQNIPIVVMIIEYLKESYTKQLNSAKEGFEVKTKAATLPKDAVVTNFKFVGFNLDKLKLELNQKFENLLQNPEKHPKYEKIWRKWYCKQRGSAGKGDTTEQWQAFWNNYLTAELSAEVQQLQELSDKIIVQEKGFDIDERINVPEAATIQIDENPQDLLTEIELDEECILIEPKRVLIEVSDDEDTTMVVEPTALEKDSASSTAAGTSQEVSSVFESLPYQKMCSQKERMKVAIQIAHELMKKKCKIDEGELEKLVNFYFTDDEAQNDKAYTFDLGVLTDADFVVLYGNFEDLSPEEQNDFTNALRAIEKQDPERFENIKRLLKEKS